MNGNNLLARTIKNTSTRIDKTCKNKCFTYNPQTDDCIITNTHISLRDCSDVKNGTKYHYITPCELNVDTLQYAFNNG